MRDTHHAQRGRSKGVRQCNWDAASGFTQRMLQGTLAVEPVETRPPDADTRSAAQSAVRKPDLRLVVALGAVWLLWGSTFAGMRFAVATIPPFAMASLRFGLAGLILYALCAATGRGRITRGDLVRAAITGATLLLLGNGMTAWTVQFLPTGINSLLLSLAPVWMAIIAFLWGGERPTRVAMGGMVLGFIGLGLLLAPRSSTSFPLWPAALSVLASVAWAFGSIYQRRAGYSANLILATALQMLVGGILLAGEAAVLGEWQTFDVHAVSAASLAGFAWLVVFGSLFAYSAYLYTMQRASTAVASTYAYVNPVVAVVIGMVVFHERFTPAEAGPAAVILTGVALMILPARRRA